MQALKMSASPGAASAPTPTDATVSQIFADSKPAISRHGVSGSDSNACGVPCGSNTASPASSRIVAPDASRSSTGPRPTK